ncbi:MAG: PEP-utilizing enzyme [Candidatus Micrarchaeota archaeon]
MKTILKGMGTSEGKAQGKVKIIESADDHFKFREGDILVTRITDPTMTVLMNRAAAIVCDIGGLTSHPSIVAREMGIPCVVNTKEGTKKLKDGEEVLVDGKKGEICRLD